MRQAPVLDFERRHALDIEVLVFEFLALVFQKIQSPGALVLGGPK